MIAMRCPGQDLRFWNPEDICEIACKNCGYEIEFFKTDAKRVCSECGHEMLNPKMDMGCLQWCEQAEECLGYDPKVILEELQINI